MFALVQGTVFYAVDFFILGITIYKLQQGSHTWQSSPPLPEEDLAMAISNMHRKFGKDHACSSGDILVERQTERHTDILITILAHLLRGFARR